MNTRVTQPVQQAIVLAAGNGDRFKTAESKLLRPLLGVPLIVRTLESAVRAGIRHADIVIGYQADQVRELVLANQPEPLSVRFHVNPRWHEENGLSVLAAREYYGDRRFALLMADHLFDSELLERLLSAPAPGGVSVLAIDRRPAPPHVADEATRVRIDRDGRIVAIGKRLDPYDALDTGIFVCAAELFDAIDASCETGDTTLSGGISRLAARGLVLGVDVGDCVWYDIDTIADLETAEDLLRAQPA